MIGCLVVPRLNYKLTIQQVTKIKKFKGIKLNSTILAKDAAPREAREPEPQANQ